MLDSFAVGNTTFSSRLLVGTGKYASYNLMHDALVASQSDIVTVALRRVGTTQSEEEKSPAYRAAVSHGSGPP